MVHLLINVTGSHNEKGGTGLNIPTWLSILPQLLILLPAAVFCYLPMKHQRRYSAVRTSLLCALVLIPYILGASFVCSLWHIQVNFVLLPSLAIFFFFYHHTLKTDLARSLAVYLNVCTLLTFSAQFAYCFDAWLHPDSGAAFFSSEAALFQLGIACLFIAVLAYPVRRWFTWMIDCLAFPRLWYSVLPLSGVFFFFNIAAIPLSYRTLHTGRIFYLFPILEFCCMALLLCLYVIFYHLTVAFMEHNRLEQRSRLLEMQAHQYQTLQEYIRQTARQRHDFRHSVHLLASLAKQGNLDGIRLHLSEYEDRLAQNKTIAFCTNAALNALFNYYHELAVSSDIQTNWSISLPSPLTVSELDMAGLFGNLLENAIAGCQTLPAGQRYFSLTAELRYTNLLYIVSTNSFNGQVRKGQDRYLSTKHDGNGTGLSSIHSVVEKYCGSVRFYHSGQEFFTDIMIKI